jgi:hypothetical protein
MLVLNQKAKIPRTPQTIQPDFFRLNERSKLDGQAESDFSCDITRMEILRKPMLPGSRGIEIGPWHNPVE